MNEIEQSFDSAICKLSNLRRFFAETPIAERFRCDMPIVGFSIYLRPRTPYDIESCRELAKAIGGEWTCDCNGAWHGKLLGFEVVISKAEQAPEFRPVNLQAA